MLKDLDDKRKRLLIACIAFMAVVGIVLSYVGNRLPFVSCRNMIMLCGKYILLGSVIAVITILAIWLIYHRIYRGVKYAFLHYRLVRQLKIEFITILPLQN